MSAVFRSSWLLFSLAVTSLLPAPLSGGEVTERQAEGVSPFRRNTGPAEQTLSASQQFIVHGTDATVRAHVCGVLERLRDDFVHLIGGRAPKNDPTTGAPIQEATPGAIALPAGEIHMAQTGIADDTNVYNAAVAEVGDNDVHRRAVIGVSVVSSDRRHANEMLDTILSFVSTASEALVLERAIEIETYEDHFGLERDLG